jgi:hypothetical protein
MRNQREPIDAHGGSHYKHHLWIEVALFLILLLFMSLLLAETVY